MNHPIAEQTIDEAMRSRLDTIKRLWELYQEDPEGSDWDYGNIHEYGLDLLWDADKGCIVWLLSTGGPHEEIQFWGGRSLDHVIFVYKDWFEYAERTVTDSKDCLLLNEMYDWINEAIPREE